jgi:hypothetical protein
MKQYKHKQTGWIAFKRCDNEYNIYTKAENFLFQTAKELIENTNDWEEVKPEPKYEVGDWVKYRNGKEKEEIGCIKTVESEYDICIYGVGYISVSQIKCKVKPKKLWFNVYEDSEGYYIGRNYLYESEKENSEYLKTGNFLSTHSITIYEEVEE